MKPGLFVGYEETMEVIVTTEMVASFGGEVIHSVLSTVSMIYYMEWVGRNVIIPFLEADEEGIGASISIQHRAPAPVGRMVVFRAIVTEIRPKKVVCRVTAEYNQLSFGEGEFVQVVLPKERIQCRIREMSE